jgi:hypothetical protein
MTSMRRARCAFSFVAQRPVDEGGIFWPAVSLARGRPRALAAFVERPQAACSNRRYVYSLERAVTAVNGKISVDLVEDDRMIISSRPSREEDFSDWSIFAEKWTRIFGLPEIGG